jgi:hypothetical protein
MTQTLTHFQEKTIRLSTSFVVLIHTYKQKKPRSLKDLELFYAVKSESINIFFDDHAPVL